MKTKLSRREEILLQLKLSRAEPVVGVVVYTVDGIEYHVSRHGDVLHIDIQTIHVGPDKTVVEIISDLHGEEEVMLDGEAYVTFPPLKLEVPTPKTKKKFKALKTLGLVTVGAAVALGGYVVYSKLR